jgi:hypothetical protein
MKKEALIMTQYTQTSELASSNAAGHVLAHFPQLTYPKSSTQKLEIIRMSSQEKTERSF